MEEEVAVPTYNSSETMHNKWLEASRNHMYPYEATVDDYCRSTIQSIQYQNFLKGHLGGTSPDKSILKLCTTRRSSDPAKMAKAMNVVSEEA